MSVTKLSHHININREAQKDIKWWWDFLLAWNRKSIIPELLSITSENLKFVTDASSTIGFGAVYKNSWIQGRWDVRASLLSMDVKELFAIVAAVLAWGTAWEGNFITDNLPITQVWQQGSSASKPIMFLTRKLYLVPAKFGFPFH